MHTSDFLKTGLIAGLAVLVVGTAAASVVVAAALPSAYTPRNLAQRQIQQVQFETALANGLHISVDQLHQAVKGAHEDTRKPRQISRLKPSARSSRFASEPSSSLPPTGSLPTALELARRT